MSIEGRTQKPDWTLKGVINDVVDSKERRDRAEPRIGGSTQLPTGGGFSETGASGQFTIDQGGGTGGVSTYGALVGVINSSNKVFTVSTARYQSGTLKVWLRGTIRAMGTAAQEWDETSPNAGTFTFVTAPETGDFIIAEYQET